MFPKSHPYMLALHCIRDLTREKVASFFRSSLILELDKRLRLLEREGVYVVGRKERRTALSASLVGRTLPIR